MMTEKDADESLDDPPEHLPPEDMTTHELFAAVKGGREEQRTDVDYDQLAEEYQSRVQRRGGER